MTSGQSGSKHVFAVAVVAPLKEDPKGISLVLSHTVCPTDSESTPACCWPKFVAPGLPSTAGASKPARLRFSFCSAVSCVCEC